MFEDEKKGSKSAQSGGCASILWMGSGLTLLMGVFLSATVFLRKREDE